MRHLRFNPVPCAVAKCAQPFNVERLGIIGVVSAELSGINQRAAVLAVLGFVDSPAPNSIAKQSPRAFLHRVAIRTVALHLVGILSAISSESFALPVCASICSGFLATREKPSRIDARLARHEEVPEALFAMALEVRERLYLATPLAKKL
jgi:hypothetical protein